MAPDRITLAVAQPVAVVDGDPADNVGMAENLISRASAQGASLMLFPEGFPGPGLRSPLADYDAAGTMASAAAHHSIAVCWSRMERCADDAYRLVVYVVDSNGLEVQRYERSHPATIPPSEEQGVWTAPGPTLPAPVEIDGVPMAVVVCSELWVPEPTRVHAVRGAEVILSPAGGGFTTLTDNWQVLVRARAVENLCHVALTNNRWGDEQGAAMIAGPESVLGGSGTADLVVATLDLARARWLRDHDDSLAEPKPFSSIPGLVRARRPELYGALVEPAADLFAYGERPPGTRA